MLKHFKATLILLLLTSSVFGKADTNTPAQQLAFTHIGPYMSFQYGLVYSYQYGRAIAKYDEQDILPVLGADTALRFGVGYNYNQNIAFETAIEDTGVELNHRRNDITDNGVTQQSYDFDIYNLTFAAVFKNNFQNLNSNIYAKLGFAYSYGELDINYNTNEGLGPSWNDFNQTYHDSFTTNAIVPLFDVGAAWSANRYLAFTFDYERTFRPMIGKGKFNDPMQSKMQALNSFLLGAFYSF